MENIIKMARSEETCEGKDLADSREGPMCY
jgi:hypothetical protein